MLSDHELKVHHLSGWQSLAAKQRVALIYNIFVRIYLSLWKLLLGLIVQVAKIMTLIMLMLVHISLMNKC